MKKFVCLGLMAIALSFLVFMTGACTQDAPSSCKDGYNYCQDPGGGGVDLCCPASAPYYCVNRKGCIPANSDAFSDGSCGTKYFCSSEY